MRKPYYGRLTATARKAMNRWLPIKTLRTTARPPVAAGSTAAFEKTMSIKRPVVNQEISRIGSHQTGDGHGPRTAGSFITGHRPIRPASHGRNENDMCGGTQAKAN